jgi:alpha-beta hydrolase superfamily lysophospholipase
MSVGPFQPFWIEGAGRRLYAAWHPGQPGRAASAQAPAVLLLPPLLHEHYRSIRFLCELASSLSAQGLDCLRFSHTGAGDSEGEGGEADLDVVATDIGRAARALAGYSGHSRLAVVAFRSAALALPRWFERGGDCERVVAWDPVVDGAAWLRERRAEDAAKRATIQPEPGMDCSDDADLMGLAVSPRMLAQVEAARWSPATLPAGTRLWQVLYSGQVAAPGVERPLPLPPTVPGFGEGVLMDASLFFSAPLERSVRELGVAMAGAA